jgi:hypothetical protein
MEYGPEPTCTSAHWVPWARLTRGSVAWMLARVVRLRDSLWIGLAVLLAVTSTSAAAQWTTPTIVNDVRAGSALRYVTVHAGLDGVPTASWIQNGRVLWARQGRSGWTEKRVLPGDFLGGMYGLRGVWTGGYSTYGLFARRGVAGHLGLREWIFRGDVSNEAYSWHDATAPDGTSVIVLLTRPSVPFSAGAQRRMWVATRRSRRNFDSARFLWRAPDPDGAFDVAVNDRGVGLVAWASPWSVLAARVSYGRVGPVQRVAASGGRVGADSVYTDVARDGSATIGWQTSGANRTVHAASLSLPLGSSGLRVHSVIHRRFVLDDDVFSAAQPHNDGIVGWVGRRRRSDVGQRLWVMPINHGVFGTPRPLTPPARVASWLAYASSGHGAIAILWRERAAQGPNRWQAYAARRAGRRWLHTRELLSTADLPPAGDGDIEFSSCTARPTAIWVVPPSNRRQRVVSVTGPRVGRPIQPCIADASDRG